MNRINRTNTRTIYNRAHFELTHWEASRFHCVVGIFWCCCCSCCCSCCWCCCCYCCYCLLVGAAATATANAASMVKLMHIAAEPRWEAVERRKTQSGCSCTVRHKGHSHSRTPKGKQADGQAGGQSDWRSHTKQTMWLQISSKPPTTSSVSPGLGTEQALVDQHSTTRQGESQGVVTLGCKKYALLPTLTWMSS